MICSVDKTSGANPHQLVFGFSGPPTTWNFGGYAETFEGGTSTAVLKTALSQGNTGSSTGNAITASSSTATEVYRVEITGVFTATTAGNMIPAFRWTLDPGTPASFTGGGTVQWPCFLDIEPFTDFGLS